MAMISGPRETVSSVTKEKTTRHVAARREAQKKRCRARESAATAVTLRG